MKETTVENNKLLNPFSLAVIISGFVFVGFMLAGSSGSVPDSVLQSAKTSFLQIQPNVNVLSGYEGLFTEPVIKKSFFTPRRKLFNFYLGDFITPLPMEGVETAGRKQ